MTLLPDSYVLYEKHHILPRSQGGKDDLGNLVFLTLKEHRLAHLLLWKIGDPNQILAVECFNRDYLNPDRPWRFQNPVLRNKRWIRKAVALQEAFNTRERRRKSFSEKYKRSLELVEADYIDALLDVAFMLR